MELNSAAGHSAKGLMKRGLLWLGSASALMRAIELLSTIAIWWFLTGAELGLAALSWSIGVVLEAFNGLGVGTALVQAPKLSDQQKHSLFWFSILLAVLVAGIVSSTSSHLAAFFGDSALRPLIVVSILRLVFLAIALVPMHLLIRHLKFKELAVTQAVAALLAAVTKIGLAAAGFGAWALVIAYSLEGFMILLGVMFFSRYRPKPLFSWRTIRSMVFFGFKVASSGIIYHAYRNLDYFVLGRFLGPAAVGVYKVGFDIAMLPAKSVLDVVNRSAFPVYARLQEQRKRLKATFLWTARSLALLIAPIPVFLTFSAHDLLAIIAGGQWIAATHVVQILSWAAALRCLAQLTPQVFHAVGKPELAVYDSAITFGVLAIAFLGAVTLSGHSTGAVAIAWAWLISYPVLLFILYIFLRRVIAMRFAEYLSNLIRPLLAMFVMSVSVFALTHLIDEVGVVVWVSILTKAAVTMLVYFLFAYLVLGIRRTNLFSGVWRAQDEPNR